MRVVRPLLAPKIGQGVATAATASRANVITRPEALHRRPDFDQRTIDAKMIAREQSAHTRLFQDRAQKFRGNLARHQSIAVLGNGRMVPHRLIDAKPTNQRNSR
jgi:hypothetical protein